MRFERQLVAVALAGVSWACGGSSSETPYPVEPDFRRLEQKAEPDNHVVVLRKGKRLESQQSPRESSDPQQPLEQSAPPDEASAPSTWGDD